MNTVTDIVPSAYQIGVFNFVDTGTGNAIVKAVPGSGKSTTIKKALRFVRGSSLFLAFNKAIASELKKAGVNARTFHSMCWTPVLSAVKLENVDQDKLWKLIDANFPDKDIHLYGAFARKMVGIARQSGVGCLIEDTEEVWHEIAAHHDIEPESEVAVFTDAISAARFLLRLSNECKTMVDFDDLLYLAVKEGISIPKYDFLFVDEAQDTNAIQRALIRKAMKPNSRIVAVGDPMQSIYGFRGADSDSMDLIAEEFNCIELPLTVCYRCPTAVIEYARQWIPYIEAAPNAPKGEVVHLGFDWNPTKVFQANDLVICRTTKPLIAQAYRLIRERIPAQVMGREIGQGLLSLIKRMNARDLEQLAERLSIFTMREYEKAIAARNESKAAAIEDKTATIYAVISSLTEDERSIDGLRNAIEMLFREKQNAVVFATIHRAKGLEAKRVFWLNSSQCPSKWAKQDWQKLQEVNLCVVASTRAQESLFLIEEKREEEG